MRLLQRRPVLRSLRLFGLSSADRSAAGTEASVGLLCFSGPYVDWLLRHQRRNELGLNDPDERIRARTLRALTAKDV